MTFDQQPSTGRTHAVENQPPPLEDYNAFERDMALAEALRREGGDWGEAQVRSLGAEVGSARVQALSAQANRNPPVARSHDRFGHRIDEVEFHPAWHELMRLAVGSAAHALPWREARPGAHATRAALVFLLNQGENGICCPIAMTFAAVPALRARPVPGTLWERQALSTSYDPRALPADEKTGVLFGMALTEKQGGSDVRANEARAVPVSDTEALLTGHKWFCSAPMCDAFLVLAQAPSGLTCYLLPRVLPDGERNAFRIQRLKDKLGNRSNASSEIELEGAYSRRLGEEGRGVATIIEMVVHTRLDCALGSTALMRRAVAEATHHAAHRAAFGKPLAEQPLMQNVLADLCLDAEAATVTALRLARAYDEGDHAFRRLATSVSKYWICKATPPLVAEALECLGGNGYVEESALPRLFRESPLNSIWEGSGNVNSLDVLRAMEREPESVEALRAELLEAAGGNRHLDVAVADLEAELADMIDLELRARRIVEHLALCLQASLLVRHAPTAVADAFCATRLGGEGGRAFGTLPRGADCVAIVERHRPRLDGGQT